MSEFECFILVVFFINCILNVFVMAYFRVVIKEEKHLDEILYEVSKYWHEFLKFIKNEGYKKETGKDGLE